MHHNNTALALSGHVDTADSQVGKVAIVPTLWYVWQKHDLEESATGASGMAVGTPWHFYCLCNECVID